VLPAFEGFLRERVAEGAAAHVAVIHAQAPERAEELRGLVARVRPTATIDHVGELGAVVGTQGGPGTLGLAVLAEA
jgi:fatty acid-binding protein DegV